jgi:predicted nucleic acid-binding protein
VSSRPERRRRETRGSDPPILCDTGAILDYLNSAAPDHFLFRSAIDRARARYLPELALVEIDYFLRHERAAMHALMEDVERSAFILAPAPMDVLVRAMEVDRQYEDLGLGLVDASIVVLAGDVGVRRLATRDVRHFSAVRLPRGETFELIAPGSDE